jgi:hypothetical protein
MDVPEMAPTPMPGNIVTKLLPVVMLVAAVGMTVFLFVAFRAPTALIFGGMMIVSLLGYVFAHRVRGTTRLALGILIAALGIGMSVVFYIVSKHNPSAFMFGAMMALSTAGLLAGSRSESKR